MSTAETDFDPEPFAGAMAAKDYQQVRESQQPRLRRWIERLPSLSDADLRAETERAICDAAHANSVSLPYDESHTRATACSHESGRRMVRDGHTKDCGPSIYSRAYRQVTRNFGYDWPDPSTCRCEPPAAPPD